MSKEEIIKYIKDEIENETDTMNWFEDKNNATRKQIEESINAHQGLLDLYNKEKEKNKYLEETLNSSIDIRKYWISKDKIKEKIEEIDKEPCHLSWSSGEDKELCVRHMQELLQEE